MTRKPLIIGIAVIAAAFIGYTFFSMPEQLKPEALDVQAADSAPTTRDDVLKPTHRDVIMGDANADITIIEYASLSCHHCAHFHQNTLPGLKKDYVDTGKVRFIFRDFPLNAPALIGSMISRCMPEDQYYRFIGMLFDKQKDWATSQDFRVKLQEMARSAGMTKETYDTCLQNKELETYLLQQRKYASEILEVKSTPSLYVNGTPLVGAQPLDEIAKALAPLLDE